MKALLIGISFAAAAATPQALAPVAPGASGAQLPAPQHPALYSFADVYRLTVAGPMGGLPVLETPEAPIRVAVQATATSSPELRFSVAPAPQPDTWLLVLAGLAAAGWVAHRRLVRAL
jgi:hypothetical protein